MNVVYFQVGDWLGLQPPVTETEMLRIVERQLAPAAGLNGWFRFGLQRSEIDAAIIPLRTLQHRRSRRKS